MKFRVFLCCVCLASVPTSWSLVRAAEVDVRDAALPMAHLAVYGKHNPERDYQRDYLAQVWQTVQEEKIPERILKIATSRMSQEKIDEAQRVIDEACGAIDSSLKESILDCEELLYVQMMQFPMNHHLIALRYPNEGAEKIEQSLRNLLNLLETKSEGKVVVTRISQEDVEITGLVLPPKAPFQPAFARLDDIFLISSSQAMLSQSLEMLKRPSGKSKFDDPRFAEAFAKLPAPEDAAVIFDGRQLFKQLGAMGEFIRLQSKEAPQAVRVAEAMDLLISELAVIDYEVTVEYTEGFENRTATLGKVIANADQRLLGKMLGGGQSFEDWQTWIPADAVAYALSKGVQLHPVYERVREILQTKFPETKDALAQFDNVQEQWDLYLDRDILQSFSGENVSVTLPRDDQGQDSVFALKCSNPDRIRELLHRLVENLNKLPPLQAQQIALTSVETLPEFETLDVPMLVAFNVKPVIGFNKGWLMVGSNPECVRKILDAREGKIATIDSSEHFERFRLPVEGPVDSLSFTDLEKSIHHAADMVRKVGGIAPMFLAMAGINANAEEIKPVVEALALLPSIANVVEKFDYYQANLTVVQTGPLPDSYLKQSVTLIRPPVSTSK